MLVVLDMSQPVALELIQADLYDLKVGTRIFIHQRPALVTKLDLPLIYWSYIAVNSEDAAKITLEEHELHRSYYAAPHIFQIEPYIHQHHHSVHTVYGSRYAEDSPIDSEQDSDFHVVSHESDTTDVYDNQSSESGADVSVSDNVFHTPVHPDTPTLHQPSIFNVLASRPTQYECTNVHGTESQPVSEVLSTISLPRGALLSHCQHVHFDLPHKVSSLTLLQCKNCVCTFNGVISKVELIQCEHVTVTCHADASCSLYVVDNSDTIELTFGAAEHNAVQCITTDSDKIQLKTHSNQQHTINKPTAATTLLQLRTTYINNVFNTEQLERTSDTGYIDNNR